jgi:YVTN family beta-propeller protein
MRLTRVGLATAILGPTLVVAAYGAHRWAGEHVQFVTGASSQPADCVGCHISARGGTVLDRLLRPRYKTPQDLALSPDGTRLYATARDAGTLLVIDTAARRVLAEIPAGRRPCGVALDRAGTTAYVSDQEGDAIAVIDLARRTTVRRLPTGFGPTGVALAEDGGTLVVANAFGGDISLIDLVSGVERVRLAAGNEPCGVGVEPGGGRVLVSNLLASPSPSDVAPPASEVTVVDPRLGRIAGRASLRGAHLLESVVFTPGGDLALVTLVRTRNLVPILQVERGWVMSGGLGVIDLKRGRTIQLPLDDVDAFYADPAGVAITRDGRYAFVSHGGADTVSAIDLDALRRLLEGIGDADLDALADRLGTSKRYVVGRIAVGANPRGLAISPDGRLVYVAERLDDRIGIIDAGRLQRVASIELGGPRHETLVRRGERIFNSSAATLGRQFSCRSCHPGNLADRLQYDFESDGLGRNIVDNRTLAGIRDTAPYKWNGRNTSLYMQCGVRFARVLTRVEPFAFDDLNALVAFINSLQPPRNRNRTDQGGLTEAQARGRAIFDRTAKRDGTPIPVTNRCVTCHGGPEYTDRTSHEVGSDAPRDSTRAFDTPQLRGLALTAPYLHDGKAGTLEEIWTVYSPDDSHGVTSDLGKQRLNDLIEYLKTL